MTWKIFKIPIFVGVLITVGAISACAPSASDHNDKGLAHYQKGEYDQALAEYTKAVEINPNLAITYNNRGTLYTTMKQYDLAISDFTKAIEVDQKLFIAYINRADAYIVKGQISFAVSDLKKVIELSDNVAFKIIAADKLKKLGAITKIN